jgi:hypothetical protein
MIRFWNKISLNIFEKWKKADVSQIVIAVPAGGNLLRNQPFLLQAP